MTTDAAQVLEKALDLTHEGRAFLAEKLLESLDADSDFPIPEEWKQEILRRCQQIDRGEVELIPADKVFDEASKALG